MHRRFLCGLVVVLALGCGSAKMAPVSGKVTLNGVPVANATVTFSPMAEKGIDAGIGSVGKTNEKGEYTLQASNGQSGAVVGKHRVSIMQQSVKAGNADERPPRGGWPLENKLPKKYSDKSTLTFDVPAGGTDRADFPLDTK